MSITVTCPACLHRYQLQPSLRGQFIRCPNAQCREVFEVREDATPPPRPAESPARPAVAGFSGGSVADLVPVLTAEIAAPEAVPDGPREVPWSSQPPPPVRRRAGDEAIEPPAVEAPNTEIDEPPPVVEAPAPGPEEPDLAAEIARKRRRRGNRILVGLGLFVGVLFGAGLGVYLFVHSQQEKWLREKAYAKYGEASFKDARDRFAELAAKYPDSEQHARDEFFRDLSGLRAAAVVAPDATARHATADGLRTFRDTPTHAELAKSFAPDFVDTFGLLAEGTIRDGEKALQAGDLSEAEALGREVQQLLADIRQIGARADPPLGVSDLLAEKAAALAQALDRQRRLHDLYARIDRLLTPTPTLQKLDDAIRLVLESGLLDDPGVQKRLRDARDVIARTVVWEPANPPVLPPPLHEANPPALLIAPAIGRVPRAADARVGSCYAVARGVLYVLNEQTGDVRWATRVGIDSTQLPLRVPAGEGFGEMLLIPAADGTVLEARDAGDGQLRWQQPLAAPCLGTPVLIGSHVYVPLRDALGTVEVIGVQFGAKLGVIRIGQPLAGGAVRQGRLPRLLLPADKQAVYVLTVEDLDTRPADAPPLAALLNTGHAAGTLLGPPLSVGDPEETGPHYLILAQADGLAAMKLLAFALDQKPAPANGGWPPAPTLEAPPRSVRLPGWAEFPPLCDGESLAVVTDAGTFGLFGVNQLGNQDQALFPQSPAAPPATLALERPARGQVVQAEEGGFWVLAHGELNLYRLGIDAKKGQTLAAVWPQPLPLGTPLHAGQVSAGHELLIAVTHASPDGCRATAVEAATGRVRWQRQLGLVCQGDPIAISGRVLALDQSGGLYGEEPAKRKPNPAEWRAGNSWRLPPPAGAVGKPTLLPDADGQSVWAVSVVHEGASRHLFVRRFPPTPGEPEASKVGLPAPLAGPPVRMGTMLLLPLADGLVHRLALPPAEGAVLEAGPSWRARRLGPDASCRLVALGGTDFVVTNGSQGLENWHWPSDVGFERLRPDPLTLKGPLVGDLVAVPDPARPNDPARLCLADGHGQVRLLDGRTLKEKRRPWGLGGRVTAGPFVRRLPDKSVRVGVVIDGVHLFWLDPDQDEPLWHFPSPGDGVVGLPPLERDRLLVTDSSGRYIALDSRTGKPVGRPIRLLLSAAPAAAAVAFGSDRLFAPLSDGTVLLLEHPEPQPERIAPPSEPAEDS